jgi:mannose-1-phosphate guanylyltransferase
MIIPVVLSGGSGTRLWPLSRSSQPKQFINLVNNNTLFQDTILRLPESLENPVIICNENHRFLAAEQLRQIKKPSNGIILEPCGKNTAPAITLAALKLISEYDDPFLLVLPADHVIRDIEAFHEAINFANKLVDQNKLITFGIKPTKAETGYGYIEAEITKKTRFYNIISFKEKPSKNNAIRFLDSENYFWNSGMFMFKASVYLNEINKFEPKILSCCKKSLQPDNKDFDFIRINNDEFSKCPDKSIDYAVMENTSEAIVIPLEADWSDVGSWESLMETKSKDKHGNVIEGDVIINKVSNTFIKSPNRLISAIGVSDLIIIDTKDALLITNKYNTQNIKNTVNTLINTNRTETQYHPKVFRPWGHYETIDTGNGFQAKRISINPGAKLSLQRHRFRAEHWVIVRGIAKITCGNKSFKLKKNQSTYIPQGEIHRLENQQKTLLEIIEIQTGNYLGEDDIIRIEDDYERN